MAVFVRPEVILCGLQDVTLTTVLSYWDISHGKFWLLLPGESQLRQSRATHLRWVLGVSVFS